MQPLWIAGGDVANVSRLVMMLPARTDALAIFRRRRRRGRPAARSADRPRVVGIKSPGGGWPEELPPPGCVRPRCPKTSEFGARNGEEFHRLHAPDRGRRPLSVVRRQVVGIDTAQVSSSKAGRATSISLLAGVSSSNSPRRTRLYEICLLCASSGDGAPARVLLPSEATAVAASRDGPAGGVGERLPR